MAVFLLLLVFFCVWQLAAKDRGYSPSERRLLAAKPDLTAESVLDASYMADYETYLTDQFPMRDQWITVKTYCGLLLGKRESGGVYIARDNSLIELHSPELLQEETAVRNRGLLVPFVRDMYACGAEYVGVMLVPTADGIWADKLSPYAEVLDQEAYLRQIEEVLTQNGFASSYVNVWETLSEHSGEPVYYKTDHHWTIRGAYYGYLSYAGALAGESGALRQEDLPTWKDYVLETVRTDFHGTTAAKCGLYHIDDEIVLIHPAAQDGTRCRVVYDLGESESDSLYSYEQVAGDDPYSVYLDGNHAITEITVIRPKAKRAAQSGRSLLLIKDSYANCFVPYLTALYDEITVIDLRYYHAGMRALMEERGYTDVLVLYNLPNFLSERTVYLIGR